MEPPIGGLEIVAHQQYGCVGMCCSLGDELMEDASYGMAIHATADVFVGDPLVEGGAGRE